MTLEVRLRDGDWDIQWILPRNHPPDVVERIFRWHWEARHDPVLGSAHRRILRKAIRHLRIERERTAMP